MKRAGLITISLFVACATNQISNITPLLLHSRPITEIYREPSFHADNYNTFCVFPYSLINEKAQFENEILEKQMLFALRNTFEGKGYKFVKIDENPDFLATIDASAPYHEVYVPPSSITLPQYVPGKTITSYSQDRGSFNFNAYGDYSSYGWGTWSGNSYTTSEIPGHFTSQNYELPGYYSGAFYPAVTVQLFDGQTFENKWTGIGVGTSNNRDLRVSSQIVLRETLMDFPKCESIDKGPRPTRGIIGVFCNILTMDGNCYYPVVVGLMPDKPAQEAGIKMYDIITAIDSVSTENLSWSENIELLTGTPNTEVVISVKRLERTLQFRLTRDRDIPPRAE